MKVLVVVLVLVVSISRVLTLDGGGVVRGISHVQVLQLLKDITKQEPWQLFDLIAGTSTGGVLALMLMLYTY